MCSTKRSMEAGLRRKDFKTPKVQSKIWDSLSGFFCYHVSSLVCGFKKVRQTQQFQKVWSVEPLKKVIYQKLK